MIFLLSPAKTLDYDAAAPEVSATRPQWMGQSAQLVSLLREFDATGLARLMDISAPLAELNVQRFRAWRQRGDGRQSRPAVLAFDGDVYDGLQARDMGADDLAWAQEHVCILSGLYGILRPLDHMQPYRLEMGTALPNPQGRDLYAFWGDQLARHLNQRLRNDPSPVLVHLASEEYFRAVARQALRVPVVQCVFEERRDAGGYKVISFMAKKARGMMLRYAIERRVSQPAGLQGFAAEGYAYTPGESTPERMVFRRG